jgi:hypothetical protein
MLHGSQYAFDDHGVCKFHSKGESYLTTALKMFFEKSSLL